MLNSLAGSGYFYDPTLREVTATFLPWLVKKVGVKLDDYGKARSLVDSLIDVAQNKANGTRARKLLSIHDEIDVERAEEAQAQANALLKAQQQAEAEKVAAAEAVRVAAEKAAKAAAGDEGDEGDEVAPAVASAPSTGVAQPVATNPIVLSSFGRGASMNHDAAGSVSQATPQIDIAPFLPHTLRVEIHHLDNPGRRVAANFRVTVVANGHPAGTTFVRGIKRHEWMQTLTIEGYQPGHDVLFSVWLMEEEEEANATLKCSTIFEGNLLGPETAAHKWGAGSMVAR